MPESLSASLTQRCPDCGSTVDPESCAGLCLACLGAVSLEVELVPTLPSTRDASARWCGEYELLEPIAQGGSGIVWKARQRLPNRTVALKLFRQAWLPGEQAARRFRQEGETAARLRHPHIVPVYEVGEADGSWFISMAYIDGPSLSQQLRERRYTAREAAELIATVARAMHHAHERGVLHRDLKPGNILLDAAGTPYVTDFGLAKVVATESDLTMTGAVFGTPAYMSPEQAQARHEEVTTTTDVYALGVILYELLSGTLPFAEPDPIRLLRQICEETPVPPKVDRDMQTICLKCLHKTPELRYPTALALAEDLERWMRGETIRARPLKWRQRLLKWARRRPALAALWGFATVALACFAVLAVHTERRVRRERAAALASAAESRQRLSRQFTARGLSYLEEADWYPALLCFCEALETGTGDAGMDEANRRRFEVVLRMAPRLLRMWFPVAGASGVVLRVDNDVESSTVAVVDENGARFWNMTTGDAITPAVSPPIWPGGGKGEHFSGGISMDYRRADSRPILIAGGEIGGEERFQAWDMQAGRVWFQGTGAIASTLHGSAAPPPGFCRRNDRIIAWQGNVAQRFSLHSGLPAEAPLRHAEDVRWAALEPTGTCLFTFTKAGKLHLWNGDEPVGAPIALDPSTSLRGIEPNGGLLSLRSSTDLLTLVDFRNARVVATVQASGRTLAHGWIGPNWIYAERGTSGVTVRDALSGFPLFNAVHGARGFAAEIALNPIATATAAMNGTVRVWRTRDGEPLSPIIRCSGVPHTLGVSGDAMSIVLDSNEPAARLWRRRDRQGAEHELSEGSDARAVWFDAEGKSLRIVDKAGRLVRCDLASGKSEPEGEPAGEELKHCTRSRGGSHFVVAGERWLQRRDAVTGRAAGEKILAPEKIVAVAISAEGARIAAATTTGAVMVLDAQSGAALGKPFGEDAKECAFSLDGTRVLTSGGRAARLYDAATGRLLLPPMAEAEGTVRAIFGPHGRRILTWTRDRRVTIARAAQLWDATTGAALAGGLAHRDGITEAAFSPDGTLVLTVSEDQTARVWDSQTGAPLLPPIMHRATVDSGAFSPDGRYFCTISDNDTRVWETKTGDPVTPALRHSKAERFVWSPDGNRLATVGGRTGARVWNLSPGERPVGAMRALARLLSSHELSKVGHGAIVPLSAAELRKAWEAAAGLQ